MAVWDALAGKRIRKCTQHTGTVNSVAMPASKNGYLYASGSDDGSVRVWDVRSKQAVQALHHDYQVGTITMSNRIGSTLPSLHVTIARRCRSRARPASP